MYDLKWQGQRTRTREEEKKVDFRKFFHSKLAELVYAINEGIKERKLFKEVS